MAKRPLKVPTSTISKADFMALQARWDRKLARHRDEVYPDGFRDVECGEDTNMLSASTFRGLSDGSHGAETVLGLSTLPGLGTPCGDGNEMPNGEAEMKAGVFHAPRARAWMMFSQAAHDLPTDRRTRDLLVAIGETGNIREVARRRRVSHATLHRLAVRLCAAIKIEPAHLFGPVGPTDESRAWEARRARRRELAAA